MYRITGNWSDGLLDEWSVGEKNGFLPLSFPIIHHSNTPLIHFYLILSILLIL
jgi:hypothetical protein